MRRLFGFCILVIIAAGANAQSDRVPLIPPPPTPLMAIVFLSPECPLCQNYTLVLNRLLDRYKGQLTLYGIIPGTAYSAADLEKFKTDYKIHFDLLADKKFRLVRRLRASTTPQVFLLNKRNEVLYAGLIDNWAASLGVQRTVVTEHYLAAAIDASLAHLPIATRTTRPVGCLINTH